MHVNFHHHFSLVLHAALSLCTKRKCIGLSARVLFTWLALFDLWFRHILKFDDVRLIRKKILVMGDVQRYISLIYSYYSIDYSVFREHSFRRKFGSFFTWIINHIVGYVYFYFFKFFLVHFSVNNFQFSSVLMIVNFSMFYSFVNSFHKGLNIFRFYLRTLYT